MDFVPYPETRSQILSFVSSDHSITTQICVPHTKAAVPSVVPQQASEPPPAYVMGVPVALQRSSEGAFPVSMSPSGVVVMTGIYNPTRRNSHPR